MKINWTDEMFDFIKNNYKDKTGKELVDLFNNKFNTKLTNRKLLNAKTRIRRTGFVFEAIPNAGCYTSGHVPANKGTKGMFNVGGNKTSFKKGNKPIQYRELGSERIDRDGYVYIKTGEPNVWELKQRVIYEQHYGKLNKDDIVTFLDGNKLNLDINNLFVITKAENCFMNKHQLRCNDKCVNETAIMLSKLKMKEMSVKRAKKV